MPDSINRPTCNYLNLKYPAHPRWRPEGQPNTEIDCMHRSQASGRGLHNLIKYTYWHTVPLQRNCIVEADFDFHTARYAGHTVSHRAVHMFYWLCSQPDKFRTLDGQS